jgi:serine/threonine-protein kinase RsbW
MQRNSHYRVRYKEGIPTRTEELQRVRDAVEREAVVFGFDKETAFRLALAVDEACTNIIKHSYGNNPAQLFDLEIATDKDRFIVVLTDGGKSFDPSNLPALDKKRYFEQFNRGGLGVHIIRLVMDDVNYAVADQMNQLRMTKVLG